MSFELVIGTRNAHKGRELAELVSPHGFVCRTLNEYPNSLDVEESGQSFAENARLKASQQAVYLRVWVLADDSGLEVDALGGEPGIYSARYAGNTDDGNSDDADNNAKLLSELSSVPLAKRGARYYCHVAVADPMGVIRAESSGECRGLIRFEESGTNGFGYDPLFEVREYHCTFGELGPHVKAVLSHRARAMRAIVPELASLAQRGEWNAAQK